MVKLMIYFYLYKCIIKLLQLVNIVCEMFLLFT